MYSSYSFTTSALHGVSGQLHASAALYHRERTPGTLWTGGWVDPRAGQDIEVRGKVLLPLPGIEHRSHGRPVRSQTLYWLSYPGSYYRQNQPYYFVIYILTSASIKTKNMIILELNNKHLRSQCQRGLGRGSSLFGYWDRRLKSRSRHGCFLTSTLCCAVLCRLRPRVEPTPVQGILPNVERFTILKMRRLSFSKNRRGTERKRIRISSIFD
jgi:hypothetical protein